MSRPRLPFTRLQAFEAVARLGSFKAARDELGGSNVSKHIAELQDDLGIRLIKRAPRGELTYEGKAVSLLLTHYFNEIASLLGELRAGRLEPETVVAIIRLNERTDDGQPGA